MSKINEFKDHAEEILAEEQRKYEEAVNERNMYEELSEGAAKKEKNAKAAIKELEFAKSHAEKASQFAYESNDEEVKYDEENRKTSKKSNSIFKRLVIGATAALIIAGGGYKLIKEAKSGSVKSVTSNTEMTDSVNEDNRINEIKDINAIYDYKKNKVKVANNTEMTDSTNENNRINEIKDINAIYDYKNDKVKHSDSANENNRINEIKDINAIYDYKNNKVKHSDESTSKDVKNEILKGIVRGSITSKIKSKSSDLNKTEMHNVKGSKSSNTTEEVVNSQLSDLNKTEMHNTKGSNSSNNNENNSEINEMSDIKDIESVYDNKNKDVFNGEYEELTDENFENLVASYANKYSNEYTNVSLEDIIKFAVITNIDLLAEENPELIGEVAGGKTKEEFLNDAAKLIGASAMNNFNVWNSTNSTEGFIRVSNIVYGSQREQMLKIEEYVDRIADAANQNDADLVNAIVEEFLIDMNSGDLSKLDDGVGFAAQVNIAMISDGIARNYLNKQNFDMLQVLKTSEKYVSNIFTEYDKCMGEVKTLTK